METVIKKLDEDYKFLHSTRTQHQLRDFVTDKNVLLKERFRVWERFCKKEENSFVIHEGEFGIIGDMVSAEYPCEYDKYKEYNWENFLEWIEESQDDDYDKNEWKKFIQKPFPSVDEFKEMLIETNFGSFIMDW